MPNAKLKPRSGRVYINDCGAWLNGPYACMQPCAKRAMCNMVPCAALPSKYNLRPMLMEAAQKVQPALTQHPLNTP